MSQAAAVLNPNRSRCVHAVALFLSVMGGACRDTLDSGEVERVSILSAVTYDAQQFVAVGGSFWTGEGHIRNSDSTLIRTSPDGVTWQTAPTTAAGWLHAVTYGGGRYVAVGSHDEGEADPASTPVFYTSVDGRRWQPAEPPVAPGSVAPSWRSVAYGAGRFVAVGFEHARPATAVAATSPDGMTWTARTVAGFVGSKVTFANGMFVLWGQSNTLGISTDGVQWNPVPLDSVNLVWNITYLDGQFVGSAAYYRFGESDRFDYFDLRSPDGASWTVQRRDDPAVPLMGFTAGAGRFVAHSGYTLFASLDGMTWERTLEAGNGVNDVTYHDGQFVGVGSTLLTSADGVAWTEGDILP